MRTLLIVLIKLYRRFLSEYLGGDCRFEPSCSRYALECIDRYGAGLGVRLTVSRLRRCTSTSPAGLDPVPEADQIAQALRGELVEPRRGRGRTSLPGSPGPTPGPEAIDPPLRPEEPLATSKVVSQAGPAGVPGPCRHRP